MDGQILSTAVSSFSLIVGCFRIPTTVTLLLVDDEGTFRLSAASPELMQPGEGCRKMRKVLSGR